MALPSGEDVADRIHMSYKDPAEKKARLAVCTIGRGQEQSVGCGVLVSDQHVDDLELSEHCIITINEVVHASKNKTFKGKYQATFQQKKSKHKTFDLQRITKKLVRTASGLVLIFLNSSCTDLNHKDKICSILSESPLSIGSPRQSSPLFCFVANQRYKVVESTGENGEECVDVLKADGDTAKSASVSAKEIPQGTVILQNADDKNLMAVGILKVVNKEHFSPIWFKSSLNDLLAATPPSTPDGGQTSSSSDTTTPTTDGGQTPSTSATATPTTDGGETSSTSDTATPTTDGGQTPSTSATATPSTDGGQTPSTSATATPTTDGGETSSTSDTAIPTTDGGQTSSTSDTATLTTDGGQTSSISVVTTTYRPQSATVQPGDTSASTTDNQGLPAAGSDHTTEVDPCNLVKDKLKLQMNIENVPNTQELFEIIAHRYLQTVRPSSPEEFNDYYIYLTKIRKVLIMGVKLGSLIITVRCTSLQILEELWQDYRSGHLNEMAQKCLVTEEILTEFGLKEAKLTTTILEKEYRTCRQYFLELLVADQSVSKEVTNNDLLLEKLSKKLDRERRHIQCWKHLAFVLDVPPEERRKFDRYTEHSPTEDMFNYLDDAGKADLKVEDLKTKLKAIYRNDVIKRLNEEKYDDETQVSELLSRDDGKFIGMLSSKLDTGMNGWKSLASQFEIKHERTVQFGLPGPGPTAELFLYMSTTDGLKDLTIGELRKHFEAMEQIKLVNILPKDKDSSLVTKEVAADSDLLEAIGKCLNKNIRGVNNWRKLACRLKIPFDDYDAFDASKEVERELSATKMLFTWLENGKPKLTVKDLLNCLRKIKRFDVVELVIEEVAVALKKKKTQVYLTEQALRNLQQLRHDTDQTKKDKNVLLADLRKKAAGQGLKIIDNDGLGNCMFSALCHQLKIKKRLKQYSEMELRTELAQYLKAHPELNDFVDQKEYPTWTDYVNKMASNGHWGDGVTLLAAARHLHCDVRVISNRDYPDVFLKPDSSNCDGEQLVQLVLGHIFEDHFVSLEPVH